MQVIFLCRSGLVGSRPGLKLCLISFLVLTTLGSFPAISRADDVVYVDTDALNLRSKPRTESRVITVMGEGEQVEVLSGPNDDGWYKVRFQGQRGWAYGGYLSIEGTSEAERWIDVNRSSQSVTLYIGNEPIASYWGAMGWDQSDDGFYATAVGTYYVFSKNAPLTWTDWGQAYITYWVGFDPGRSNGFHGYMMDADGNVLPNGDGPTGGCIALAPSSAKELYEFASYGTRVEVHW